MIKKFLIVFVVFLLVGCSVIKEDPVPVVKDNEYIKPLNEINFYDELSDSIKEKLEPIYFDKTVLGGPEKVNNNLIEMIGSKLNESLVTYDYYGNEVDFSYFMDKNVIFECVQYTCEHCLKQVEYTESFINESDVLFVQYFAYGDKEQIDDFYDRANASIPSNLIVIPQDENVSKYFLGIGVDATPTFLFFKEGVMNFSKIAMLTYSQYENGCEFAFCNPLKHEELVNNEGQLVFDLNRSYNDVLNDLSTINKDKFANLENVEQLTVNIIGKYVEFYTLYEAEENVLYQKDSYTSYVNKPLVVFYIANHSDNIQNDIPLINSFIKSHPSQNVLTVLIDNNDFSTSQSYRGSDLKLKGDIVSSGSYIPKAFLDIDVYEYPAVVFIQDNTFTGGIYQFNDYSSIEYAYDIFIGDDSIALISNN